MKKLHRGRSRFGASDLQSFHLMSYTGDLLYFFLAPNAAARHMLLGSLQHRGESNHLKKSSSIQNEISRTARMHKDGRNTDRLLSLLQDGCRVNMSLLRRKEALT